MRIEHLKKSKRVLDFLARVDLESRNWVVVDDWDADLCAIGVAHRQEPRRLVYVSVFEKALGKFFYECELATGLDPTDYLVVKSGDNVNFEELLEVATLFLCSEDEIASTSGR